ncbi:IS200/IS605 family transposase [Flavobacterium sp. N502536]|uniref:IS200/IS605 family transposase n=1 Tax=Flavobacterium sp. N502536 TaxID=2986837 RepID=UPI002222714A|nr:IS200/IS605 family transposase [Flavobacterium sp. N502536]
MANTYSQLYIHIVFTVKGRQNLISKNWKAEIYKYITGIVSNKGQKLITINGMPDHIHILIGLKPDKSISDLVRDIKANSSKFINDKKWINGKFEWQNGFGAFSYSHSHLTNIIKYIENQEEHHKTRTFKEEYIGFLKLFDVDFKNEYLFDDVTED